MAETVDEAFHGAGQTPGLEIWRIEDFKPVPLPKAQYGTFYNGDSYIVLHTTQTQSGALKYDLHFWLGKNTSQDELGTAAIKTVELDQHLGDKAVQYRELQGKESDLFLSYFKPCIVPKNGGVASGFHKVEAEVFCTKLFVVKAASAAAVRVTEVPVSRDSLNHDDIFVLDTADTIYQFNGSKASIVEKGKAMQVVQQLKDFNHGSALNVVIHDGEDQEGDNEGFWGPLGGFGPVGSSSYDHSVQNIIKGSH